MGRDALNHAPLGHRDEIQVFPVTRFFKRPFSVVEFLLVFVTSAKTQLVSARLAFRCFVTAVSCPHMKRGSWICFNNIVGVVADGL